VFTPRYGEVKFEDFGIEVSEETEPIVISVGDQDYQCTLLSSSVAGGLVIYFIDCPELYDRDGLYVNPGTGTDYEDNDIRFIVFNRAILAALRLMDFRPDVLHANDWQTALLPAYLRELRLQKDPFFSRTRCLLTLHNLGYHGLFPMANAGNIGLPEHYFYSMAPFEYWGKINFLKAGIETADLISTVSETYAREIQTTEEFGCGLEGVLRDRSVDLFGVVNGVDYSTWSPEHDRFLKRRYSVATIDGKDANKKEIIQLSGLPKQSLDLPLIGVISRLADQKGFDLIRDAVTELFQLKFTFVLLGTGDKVYHDLFRDLERQYPDRVRAHLTFDNRLAHRIEAGADMFLMPSRYEPCGLNQLYSLKYGTVPIVRRTGGLADTIIDFHEDRRRSTGFLFDEYTPEALVSTVERALAVYKRRRSWLALMKRGMSKDFSWKKSARAYVRFYQRLLDL
jgi:starch synthase